MMKALLMASAVALAAPALAQTTTDPMANQPGAMNSGQPGAASTDMMMHDQHDVATPANASPTQTTAQDLDGNTGDSQTPAEGTMAVDTTGTMTTGTTTTMGTATTGTWSNDTGVAATTGTTTSTGVGGPLETATEYPVCTRQITDNCLQTPRSPTPR